MYTDFSIPNTRLSIHPGDWYFGKEYGSLYTVLGSCVALTAWHPTLKVGGLCHYLLPVVPSGQRKKEELTNQTVGRYASTVLNLMKQQMQRYALPGEYRLGLFGGSDTMSNYGIGKQNVVYAQRWLMEEKLSVVETDVGGLISRSLILDMSTGVVMIKQYPMNDNTSSQKKP